jgi:acyl-CoA oxidase
MGQVVVGNFIREGYKKMMAEVDEGNFDSLPVMHHLLAGLKAQISETMMTTVDTARRSAGGAGYQSNSGFTDLHSAASPIPTYEGDNTVMLLQSARFVFKLIKKAGKGQALPYPFQYISRAKELKAIQGKGKSVEEMLDISVIENALAVRALN